MAKKTSKKVEENKKNDHAKKEELRFSSLIDHAKEPLLLLSIFTFLASMAFPFTVPNAVPLIIFPIALGLAAVGSIVFIYKYAIDGKDIIKLITLPLVILLTASFLFWAQDNQISNNNDRVRDYSTFAGLRALGAQAREASGRDSRYLVLFFPYLTLDAGVQPLLCYISGQFHIGLGLLFRIQARPDCGSYRPSA